MNEHRFCPICGEEPRLVWIGIDPPEPYGEVCGCPATTEYLAEARDDKRASDADAYAALNPHPAPLEGPK